MISRLLTGGLARAIMILGIAFFAVFGVIAVVLAKTGNGDLQAVTAAIMGYLFILGFAALWLVRIRAEIWRRRAGALAVQGAR